MARARGACSAISHVFDELPDTRNFLDGTTDSTQPSRPLRPRSDVDSHRLLVRGHDYAVFNDAAGRISALPRGAARLLVQHSAVGGGALWQLGVRHQEGPGERRYSSRG